MIEKNNVIMNVMYLLNLCECSARRKEEEDRAQERGCVLQLSENRALVSHFISFL